MIDVVRETIVTGWTLFHSLVLLLYANPARVGDVRKRILAGDKQASKRGSLRRVPLFMPAQPRTIEDNGHVVQYIATQDSDVRINDHILPSKSPLNEN